MPLSYHLLPFMTQKTRERSQFGRNLHALIFVWFAQSHILSLPLFINYLICIFTDFHQYVHLTLILAAILRIYYVFVLCILYMFFSCAYCTKTPGKDSVIFPGGLYYNAAVNGVSATAIVALCDNRPSVTSSVTGASPSACTTARASPQ